MRESHFRVDCKNFFLKKTQKTSKEFIQLIKENDLLICPDSGPLHISLALKKDVIFFIRTTIPEIVINSGSKLKINQI